MDALGEKEVENREVVSLIRQAQQVPTLQVTIPSTSLVREKELRRTVDPERNLKKRPLETLISALYNHMPRQ